MNGHQIPNKKTIFGKLPQSLWSGYKLNITIPAKYILFIPKYIYTKLENKGLVLENIIDINFPVLV